MRRAASRPVWEARAFRICPWRELKSSDVNDGEFETAWIFGTSHSTPALRQTWNFSSTAYPTSDRRPIRYPATASKGLASSFVSPRAGHTASENVTQNLYQGRIV